MAANKLLRFRPIVLSGPSGSGKSTLVSRLRAEFDGCFTFSVSHTTRNPRAGEENGREYHFVDRPAFYEMIKNGDFVEHAEFSGNCYGTSKLAIESVINSGKICILDLEVNGVKSMKKTKYDSRYIFIKPPNEKALESRLRSRGTETEETLRCRLETAKEALDYAETPGAYDYIIVNDELEDAYIKLRSVLQEDLDTLLRGQSATEIK